MRSLTSAWFLLICLGCGDERLDNCQAEGELAAQGDVYLYMDPPCADQSPEEQAGYLQAKQVLYAECFAAWAEGYSAGWQADCGELAAETADAD